MFPMLASLKLSLRYLPLFVTGSYSVDLACLEFAMYTNTKLAWNLEKSIHLYFPRAGIKRYTATPAHPFV